MRVAFVVAVLVAVACGGGAAGPSPSASAPLSDAERKYRIVDEVGRPSFCDPDEFPVARADEASLALARFPEIEADGATLRAILAHERIPVALSFPTIYTEEQRLRIYRQWKLLGAIRLGPDGEFALRVFPTGGPGDPKSVIAVAGRVDPSGRVAMTARTPSRPAPCPICLGEGTLIDTPAGPRPVEALRAGDAVWTATATGERVAATVAAYGSTPAPQGHRIVELVLGDGRSLHVSHGHPTTDGRTVGALRIGDTYDGANVVGAARVPYPAARTYDLLASGGTGMYWANGILLGSTLRPR